MYSLEFLCWVNRCLFRKDFELDLIELGVEEMVAYGLGMTDSFGNIVDMYQSYGLKETEYKEALDLYLNSMLEQWNENNERLNQRGT